MIHPNIAVDVSICRLTAGITTYAWLCSQCRKRRTSEGWSVETIPLPKGHAGLNLFCDLCTHEKQAA